MAATVAVDVLPFMNGAEFHLLHQRIRQIEGCLHAPIFPATQLSVKVLAIGFSSNPIVEQIDQPATWSFSILSQKAKVAQESQNLFRKNPKHQSNGGPKDEIAEQHEKIVLWSFERSLKVKENRPEP